jgi:hypothetical protein
MEIYTNNFTLPDTRTTGSKGSNVKVTGGVKGCPDRE